MFNILFVLLQHVQENLKLTGGRKAGEGQPPAVQAVGAPAQAPAAAGLLEEEEDWEHVLQNWLIKNSWQLLCVNSVTFVIFFAFVFEGKLIIKSLY